MRGPVPEQQQGRVEGAPAGSRRGKRRPIQGRLLRWLHGERDPDWGTRASEFDPNAIRRAQRLLAHLFGERRYFRLSAEGFENVPRSPSMIVSNHSGGTIIPDAWGFCYAWYQHFGVERPLHPAGHELLLANKVTGPLFARLGVVRADRTLARRVLKRRGGDLLVMPGGDLDVWRPFRDRYRVRFAGRRGYARLALETGVPVVPVAHVGAHHSFIVLSDGRRFAEAVGLPKIARSSIWPVHLSLPWGLAVGPLPHIPLPVRLRYRVGAPVHPSDVGVVSGTPPTDEQVARFDALVQGGVQEQLDQLRRRYRRPWL